jgi:hypothetical protein
MAAAPPKNEGVYIECVVTGGVMKVNAIDPVSGKEVSVFGPATAREALTRTAVQKLAMVLKKAK